MKPTCLLTIALIVSSTAFAAKGNRPKKDRGRPDKALIEAVKPFDKNGNHSIDGEEVAALNKAFTEAPSGPLAALDKNKDGKIDATEIGTLLMAGAIRPMLKELDKDGNRKIEGPEIEAMRKKFEADPKGALSIIDRNSNSKLDDEEIAKFNERMASRASRGRAPATTPKTPETKPEPKTEAKPDATKAPEEAKKPAPTTKA